MHRTYALRHNATSCCRGLSLKPPLVYIFCGFGFGFAFAIEFVFLYFSSNRPPLPRLAVI